jgi:hypothetical protein
MLGVRVRVRVHRLYLPDCRLRVNFRRDARRVDSIARDCVDGEFNSIVTLTSGG